jgi:2-polyprenyl-3-methyl-5-hydroxy-6-metoxy-1,4-benzoquinol methylase
MNRSSDPERIVNLLYKAILGRPAGEEALARHAQRLRDGAPLIRVINLLCRSPEFRARRLARVGKRHVEALGSYDLANDKEIAKYRTADVTQLTDRIRKCSVNRAAFESACQASLQGREPDAYLQNHKERFYEIAGVIQSIVNSRGRDLAVLDFGVSINSSILRAAFPELRIAVADLPVKLAQHRQKFIATYEVDLEDDRLVELDLAARFDVIIFSEVVEHIRVSPVHVIRFLLNQLTSGGSILITTPNLFSRRRLHNVGRRLSPMDPIPINYSHAGDHHFHVRLYSMKELLAAITAAGGDVQAFWYSSCWDNVATSAALPADQLQALCVLAGVKKSSEPEARSAMQAASGINMPEPAGPHNGAKLASP